MKQMRSRFRLITLLLVCAFVLTLVLCAGRMLKTANITLSSLSDDVTSVVDSILPDTSASPEASPEESAAPVPSGTLPDESALPGTDNSPNPEYNIYGL